MRDGIDVPLPHEGDRMRVTWSSRHVGVEGKVGDLSFDCRRTAGAPTWPGQAEETSTCLISHMDPPASMEEVPMPSFAHLVSAPAPRRRPILAALERLLPEGVADLYGRVPPGLLIHDQELRGFYDGGRSLGRARARIALRHPALAKVLPAVLAASPDADRPTRLDAGALLRAYAPGARPGTVARILRSDWVIPGRDALDAILASPQDWFPEGKSERDAFHALCRGAAPLATVLGHGPLLAASRGRWAEYAGSVYRKAGIDPGTGLPVTGLPVTGLILACTGALDMARAFLDQALLPAMAAAGSLDDDGARDLRRTFFAPYRFQAEAHPSTADALAVRLLFGRGSLLAAIEASARWHARRPAMDDALDAICAGHPPEGDVLRPGTWPVPFPPLAAPNGVEIRFLRDAASLRHEGQAGPDPEGVPGLAHCVGGYGGRCAVGEACVASLRVAGPDGTARLTTLHVTVAAHRIKVVQHAARRNAAPPPEAKAALAWFLAEAASGRIAPDPAFLSEGWRRRRGHPGIAEACGYRWEDPDAVTGAVALWAPFLPRPLRDPAALAGAATAMLPDVPRHPARPEPVPGTGLADRIASSGAAAAMVVAACHAADTAAVPFRWLSHRREAHAIAKAVRDSTVPMQRHAQGGHAALLTWRR